MQFVKSSLLTNPRQLAQLLLALLMCLCAGAPLHAQTSGDWAAERWVASWGAAPAGPPLDSATTVFNNQTLRLIVHTSTAGNRARIRLSNEMGAAALRIGAAQLALRASGNANGANIVAGSTRALTFSGATATVVPPGAAVLSDPVDLAVPALSDVAVSLYLPGEARASTLHATATQTSYVSSPGNFTGATTFPVQRTIEQWPFLTELDVAGTSGASAGAVIVTLGDSITDGLRSWGDTNNRWPDWLARRLQGGGGGTAISRLGVVNRGISGNRLLSNPQVGSLFGRSAQERFDRDVLATAGARYLTVLIGVNDLINSSSSAPLTAADLIAGYRQLIARAHAKGIAVHGATLTPYQGADYFTPAMEQVRQATNSWIRTSGEFDAVLDFDALLRDPAYPQRLNPSYDSGDHIHPNNAGYQAMGYAIPLSLFTTTTSQEPEQPPSQTAR